jgi:hypothetical protein
MISDVLSECVTDLDHYLNDPGWNDHYPEGDFRDRIIRFRNEAEYLRALLDLPPTVPSPPISEAELRERIAAQRTLDVEDRCYLTEAEANALNL